MSIGFKINVPHRHPQQHLGKRGGGRAGRSFARRRYHSGRAGRERRFAHAAHAHDAERLNKSLQTAGSFVVP